MSVGLALSGGGSRAAAFHAGTVGALEELGLLPAIDVVSTVSGGSIFGAAWAVSIADGESTNTFLSRVRRELQQGFVARSITWHVLRLPWPGFTRSDLLAGTFDRVFFKGRKLADLPQRPLLCINTTVLNNGQVGKFARDGFSTADLGAPRTASGSNVPVLMPTFPLARAATASAAFPIGLPPILVGARELGQAERRGNLAGRAPLALTDGGVLENLGVQTLLKSRRFGTWDLIISDAGLKDRPWRPRSFGRWLAAFAIAAFSASVLRRVLELMNDKESRSMRSLAVAEVERSWLNERLVRAEKMAVGGGRRRRLLFVRVNQSWESFIANIPHWRLAELNGQPPGAALSAAEVKGAVEKLSGRLKKARDIYEAMGGDARVDKLNNISTGFTALSPDQLDGLEKQARWQVFATHAVFWEHS